MKDLHNQFVFYGKNAREWMRKCELLLPEIDRQRVWKKKGYGSIYEYAAKLAGMNNEKVRECLRICRHIEDKPALKKVAESKGLLAVKPVATISKIEDAEFWAEKAKTLPKNALEKYVQSYREESRPRTTSQPVKITMELTPELAAKLQKMKGDQDWNEFMEKLTDQPKPEPVKTESRHIPNATRRYVLAKTGGKCACCNRQADVVHHVNRFAKSQEHDPDKVVPLCKGHHQLAHFGLILNENALPTEWKVREHARPNSIDQKWLKYANMDP